MKPSRTASTLVATCVTALVVALSQVTLAAGAPGRPGSPAARHDKPTVAAGHAALARVSSLPDAAADRARVASGKVVAVASVPVSGPTAVAGVTWAKDSASPSVVYRTVKDGQPSAWLDVEVDSTQPGEGGTTAGTAPLVVTNADTVEFATLTSSPIDAELSVYSSSSPEDQMVAVAPAAVPEVGTLASPYDSLRPTIKGRAEWGANEQIVGLPYEYGIVSGVMIHHDAGSNSYTAADVPGILRSIQAYHVNSRGWKDIGYNILVDKFGTAWEGRGGGLDRAVSGGHAFGETNKRVFGLSFLGNYETAQPSSAMISKAQDIIAWKFALHGVDPYGTTWGSGGQDGGSTFLNAISGHRDENATACPGANVYPLLPQIRAAVKSRLSGVSYKVTQPQPTPVETLPSPDPVTGKVLLPVTGSLDKATVIELQKWVGATVDGVWGSGTNTALQQKIGAAVTGVRDTQTIQRLQGVIGAAQTGYLDSQTILRLQGYLNFLPGSNEAALGAPAYAAYVQDLGGLAAVANGGVAGTTGQSRRMEAFRLSLAGAPLSGGVQYRGYVQNIGWQAWTDSSGHIGTLGKGLRLEAFEIKLTGDLATRYSVRYKAFVWGYGWQYEKVDGETAGTIGRSLPIEAIAVELVDRTTLAPATTVTGPLRSVDPCRVLDTRVPTGVPSRMQVPGWGRVDVDVTGPCGVPDAGVGAVALNVTVTNGSSAGYLSVYPTTRPTPWTSNLNFTGGQTIANTVVANIGTGGRVTFFNGSPTPVDILADVSGWIPTGASNVAGALNSMASTRILDTRGDDQGQPLGTVAIGPVGAQGTIDVKVLGRAGVPASNVSAVIVNLTVTGPRAPGFLTAFPSDAIRPEASNANFRAGETIPNLAIVKVGADGGIKIHNGSDGTTHVIADIAGWITGGAAVDAGTFASLTPTRILDTRGSGGVALGAPIRQVPAKGSLVLDATDVGGVPAVGVGAVVLNLTVTNATAPGWVVAYPTGGTMPTASNVNFVAGQTIPNLVVVRVGTDGRVTLYNDSTKPVDLVADVAGYIRG